jgi:hypothetical protein
LQRFESLLLGPTTILGTPAEAGLNQKNSTSLNGARKNLSNLELNFVTYLWDITMKPILK